MVDNTEIKDENQIKDEALYETVTVDSSTDSPAIEEIPDEVGSSPPPPVYTENKNQMIFLGLGGLVFLFVFIFLIKIIFGGSSKVKSAELTYWGLWDEVEIVKPLIDLYQQKNPHIKITYQKMTPQSYREKLLARSKNNQGPDIFRFHNTWLPEIKELVTPLPESVMSKTEFDKTFYTIHQKDLKVGNHYYGIPLSIDGLVLVYNDGLFKKAGVSTTPVTWDDVIDIASKLTVHDKSKKIITSGIAIGTSSNIEHFSDIFGLLLAQNGGDITKLDQSEASGALESYRKFAEQPLMYWSDEMPNSLNAFIQEKVAMILVPSWQILSIKAANPDINLKVMMVPSVPGGKPISVANYWVEGVSRYSTNQIEAWKFLRFLSEKDNLTKLYELQTKSRLFGTPYSRIDLANLLIQNEYIGPVIKQADYYVSLPLVTRTYDNGLNDEIIKYIENAINSTIQGVSYEEALRTAKLGITQVFTKYNIN